MTLPIYKFQLAGRNDSVLINLQYVASIKPRPDDATQTVINMNYNVIYLVSHHFDEVEAIVNQAKKEALSHSTRLAGN